MAQKNSGKRPAKQRTTKKSDDHAPRTRTLAAVGAVGALAAGIGAAFSLGWFDRLFRRDGAEHAAPDLAASAPTPGTERAPDAFRPDPTAAVPDSEREALRPATGPAPTLSADRGEMANQTSPANG